MNNKINVYFISGLGADENAFKELVLPKHWNVIYLHWIEVNHNESLQNYVLRFCKMIDTNEPFSIVGLSFGGIVAIELSKIIHPLHIVIISSIVSKKELSLGFKITAFLGLNKIIPTAWYNKVFPFANWFFGVENEIEKQALQKIIQENAAYFLKWAINEILHWNNNIRPNQLFHIHGTRDHVFPSKYTNADCFVENGGHFMIHNKADIISKILVEKIQ
jgi:hypothetical protein